MNMINSIYSAFIQSTRLTKNILGVCALLLFTSTLFGQQEAQYTNFMFNKLPLNAGYAGSKEVACVSALHRSQWVGIDEAPTTQSINFHTPLFGERVGFGLGIEHDALGLTGTWRGNVSYSYRPKIGKGRLGIGVTGSVIVHEYRGHEEDPANNGDPSLAGEYIVRTYPNFGAGLYYNTETFYAGISVPTLLSHEINYEGTDIETTSYKDRRHLYIMMGGLLNISEKIKFKPAVLVKSVSGTSAERKIGAPLDVDLNAMFLFLDAFGVGATWRMGDSIDALLVFQAAEQFRIGLGYDFTLTELQTLTNGTFEVMAEYCFRSRNKKLLNPRFFF